MKMEWELKEQLDRIERNQILLLQMVGVDVKLLDYPELIPSENENEKGKFKAEIRET